MTGVQTCALPICTHFGQIDGIIQTTEWTVCEGKNAGKKNETTADAQALKEAQATWKKKVQSGYFDDIKKIDEVAFTEPMLAKSYDDYKDEIKYPVYSQPKLDGIRCIVKKDGMWSRNGKPIISAPHIRESLDKLFQHEPDLILDGELYADKFANDFNRIVSLVKKTKPTAEDLKESAKNIEYHVYDLPYVDETFAGRLEALNELAPYFPKCVKKVETHIITDEFYVNSWYENYIERGYEGQMLRLDSKYENKRSKSLLKHKSFLDEEFTIVDICEGEGNRAGTAGYFVFNTKDGKPFKSNVKGTWEETAQMLKDRKRLIGKEATVKYFNLTPDGIPRFPYVISIDRNSYE